MHHILSRRKKKVVHKTTTTDDKRLQNTLKRLGINSIPAIEEVNLFMESGEVVHFTNPKGANLAIAFSLLPEKSLASNYHCRLTASHPFSLTFEGRAIHSPAASFDVRCWFQFKLASQLTPT